MFYMAAFAEYAIVDDACAIAVPQDMPADRACLIGCGVMTGVGAALHFSEPGPGDSAMIIGYGAVGLSAIQGTRLAGANVIVGVDRNPQRLELARRVGATHVVQVPQDNPIDVVRGLTDGRGADCILESAGNQAGFRLSVEACRTGGRVIWLGKTGVNDEVSFRWGSLMGEKRILRSSYGGAKPSRDFLWLAQAYLGGKLQLDDHISARISLEKINEGFDDLRQGHGVRTVVVF
jgi:S-(hydroxymethyl)glutathione dehydrogenase / alcohol dehydrogenase